MSTPKLLCKKVLSAFLFYLYVAFTYMAIHVHMHFHSSSPCKQKFFRRSFEIWSNELSRSSETPSIHFYKAPAEVSYSENSLTFKITINFMRRILVTPRYHRIPKISRIYVHREKTSGEILAKQLYKCFI